ncbi:cache domain-containing sensor histidine kinase [Gracilibacillus boraciitolerans]|uniref:cache domain-containing sensor histidine kinase n=1 Tax=Gracilibacillus boraciitolerans TaxID=307521 RepID=UPI000552FDAC|nr:sensor histidine kinase [Gracilibacillus boraciitolerans]
MRHFFRSLPIRNKIFITFASVYVIVITVIGIVMYLNNVNEMKNQTQSMSKVLSTQFSRTIDLYFEDIERLSLAIFTDSVIQDTLSNYEEDLLYNDISIRNSLYPRLFNQVYPQSDVAAVTIHTDSGTIFDYEKSGDMEVRYATEDPEWVQLLKAANKNEFLILPTSEVEQLNGQKKQVVSLIRDIYKIPQRNRIGSMKIDIDVTIFEKLLEMDNVDELEEHMRIFVMSANESVIYDHRKELIGENNVGLNLPTVTVNEPEDGTLSWQSDSYLYANDHSDFTNWNTVVLIDNEFIIYERNQILLFIAISGLVAFSVIGVISYLLSYNITKPFNGIIQKMRRVEKGDLTDRMKLTGHPEMDVLTRVYNNMLDSINKLITEVYEASITEKNAKISALQSQINPHFLYNTLNIMKSISRVKGVEEVAEISESLSDLFKYSMKDLDKTVTLQEEVTHVENYMRIQQHRFRDRFVLTKDISPEANQISIPKLLIQPIVENAVNHGLKDKKAEGVILLKAFLKENDLVIKIQDNGNGMNPETLEYVRKKVSTNRMKTDTEGIGLNNIAQRLQLMYGYRYRMQIDSEENTGTNVTIILPAHVI